MDVVAVAQQHLVCARAFPQEPARGGIIGEADGVGADLKRRLVRSDIGQPVRLPNDTADPVQEDCIPY